MKAFNVKISFDFDRAGFETLNWRVFIISVVVGFIFAALQHFGIQFQLQLPSIPAANQSVKNAIDIIQPKLEEKKDQYKVKKQSSLIPQSYASSDVDKASAYAVVDFNTGDVISEKDISRQLPIASLTKIMTAVVTLDLVSPDDVFSVSERAADEIPTKMGLPAGDKLTVKELLHALLMTSANDAAEVLAEGVNVKYGQDIFIQAMNNKAKFLHLNNTHFENPQGFDADEHYSSAEDLVILAHYALTHYSLISEIVKKDYQFIPANGYHRQMDLYNWNGLLDVYPDTIGVKIGNTDKAGMTTVVVSNRNSKKLIAVVLGAPGVLERDLWASQLLDAGYQVNMGLPPVNVTETQLRDKYSTWKYWQ